MIKEPFGISDACNKKILLPLLFIIHFGLVASHLQCVKIFSVGARDFSPVLCAEVLVLFSSRSLALKSSLKSHQMTFFLAQKRGLSEKIII